MLGEAPERAGRRVASPMADDEDDEDGVDARPPVRRGRMERMREEVQRVEGGCVAPSGGSSGVQASRRWSACARASSTRPPAYWQEVEDGGGCGGLGCCWAAQCWAADGLPGKLGGFPSYSIFLLFSIFLLLFWL